MFNVGKKSFPPKLKFPRELEEENVVPLRFEEVYAMLLRNLKKNAERTAGMKFQNAVFTIWDNSMSIEQRKKLATSIIISNMYPSAFVHENTAAAIYYAFNSKLDDPSYDSKILIINIGSLGVKMSIVRVKNAYDDPTKLEGGFHQEVHSLIDKFYSEFSGHYLDHCFSNMVLNKHH